MHGMTLGEIVEEIAEKTSHSLSDDSIVRKINNLVLEIHRKYKRIPTISTLDLVAGLAEYPLPCPFTNIQQVLANGNEYKLRYLDQDGCGRFYYYLEGSIGLNPSPQEDVTEGLVIFHYFVPQKLSVSDMEAEPDIDADYRMLLVLGVCKDVAEDKNEQSYFKREYESMLQDYITATSLPLPDFRIE